MYARLSIRALVLLTFFSSLTFFGVVNYSNAQPPTGGPTFPGGGTGGVPGPTVGPTVGPTSGATGGTGINGNQPGGPCGAKFCNPLAFDTLADFLRAILSAVIMIAFPILVLFMVYAGFKFVAAQGKPEEIAKARRIFLWTLVGALIVLGAQAISIAVEETINALQ